MSRLKRSDLRGDAGFVCHTGTRQFGWLDYYIAPQSEEGVYLNGNGAHTVLPGEIFFPRRLGAGDLMIFRRGAALKCPVGAGGVQDSRGDRWGGNGALIARIALPRRMARFAEAAFSAEIPLPEAISRLARPALSRAIERAVCAGAGKNCAEKYALEEMREALMENGLELMELRLVCLERMN